MGMSLWLCIAFAMTARGQELVSVLPPTYAEFVAAGGTMEKTSQQGEIASVENLFYHPATPGLVSGLAVTATTTIALTFPEPVTIREVRFQRINSGYNETTSMALELYAGQTALTDFSAVHMNASPYDWKVNAIKAPQSVAQYTIRIRGNSNVTFSLISLLGDKPSYLYPSDPDDPPGGGDDIEYPEGLVEAVNAVQAAVRSGFASLEAKVDERSDEMAWWMKGVFLALSMICGVALMAFVWDFVRRGPI